jgi:UDP-glucose 4-epimerase
VARSCVLSAISPATDVALNIGSGTETSLYQLARKLAEVMGKPDVMPEFHPERSVNPVPKRLADVALARDTIGFETTISLDEGLKELVDWWRAERDVIAQPQVSRQVGASA